MPENIVSVKLEDLNVSPRTSNAIDLRSLYASNSTEIKALLTGGNNFKALEAFFTRGRSTKKGLQEYARRKEVDYVSIYGFRIKVLNCEEVGNDVLTFPRFCAVLALGIILEKQEEKFEGVIRSLGSGLSISGLSPRDLAIFKTCLIPGAAFIPMSMLTRSKNLTQESMIVAAAAVSLDFKFLIRIKKDAQINNILEVLESIEEFDEEVSCIRQLVRQGFFDLLNSDPERKRDFKDLLRRVSLSEDSSMGTRVIQAIKSLLTD